MAWWVRRIPDPEAEVGASGQDWARWVTARRPQDGKAGKHDYYLAWGPEQTTVEELVQVPGALAGGRSDQAGQVGAGMDNYEVRSWHGWFRHVTLAQLAAAFLAVQAAAAACEKHEAPDVDGDPLAVLAPLAGPTAQRGGSTPTPPATTASP